MLLTPRRIRAARAMHNAEKVFKRTTKKLVKYTRNGHKVSFFLVPNLWLGMPSSTLCVGQRKLENLAAKPSNGIAKILNVHEAKKHGTFPDAIFVVGAKTNYRFVEDIEGQLISKEKEFGGTHGHFPDKSGKMDAAFFAVGPNIPKKQNLGKIELVDIAPTVAELMGTKLFTATGRNVLLKY